LAAELAQGLQDIWPVRDVAAGLPGIG
jgi:hypothetical protein